MALRTRESGRASEKCSRQKDWEHSTFLTRRLSPSPFPLPLSNSRPTSTSSASFPIPYRTQLMRFCRDMLNPTGIYSPLTHVTAGGIAGGVAAAITTPLDVCKTLLQTRGSSDDASIRKARGMRDAARIIWTKHGASGFARGLTPRILTNMPSNALCWFVVSFTVLLLRY